MSGYLLTSESASEGHPDKVTDQASDAVLDVILVRDPKAHVAVEILVATDLCVLAGEVTTTAKVDYEKIAREAIAHIGYRSPDLDFSSDSCKVLLDYGQQSPDIAQGVSEGERFDLEQGAGDQGLMFGYACDRTPVLMPFAVYYNHRLMQRQNELHRNGSLPRLRPDAKAQIAAAYDSKTGEVKHIDTVALSTQHDEGINCDKLRKAVIEQIIKPVLPFEMLTKETKYLVNPTGKLIIGDPHGDCGLTGRRIIVDTYGGAASHGGGAFSSKDPSKVDRSATYACRYVAKDTVAAGLASQCQVQISYAIGIVEPTSVSIDTFDISKLSKTGLIKLAREYFDLCPKGIIQMLDLFRLIYGRTATYGHFGREEPEFTWERTNKAITLRAAAGL